MTLFKNYLFIAAFFTGLSFAFYTSPQENTGRSLASKKANITQASILKNYRSVKKIFNGRCVACHSCYNAACQLKLSSFEGIDRGLHKTLKIYNNKRTKMETHLTRLFVDAQSTEAWQNKHGFTSVLDPQPGSVSLLEQVLTAKVGDQTDPKLLPSPEMTELLQCTNNGANVLPMPYGLPALSEAESNEVTTWVQQGEFPSEATMARLHRPSRAVADHIDLFQSYLNRRGAKEELIARYIYEHLFISHIYFDHKREFFRLIRSSTPCSNKQEIISRRPYDDPKTTPYYCFDKITSTIVHKTHITYPLSLEKYKRFQELFEGSTYGEWHVSEGPSYQISKASNPFETFQAIPAKARYQFLLDNAEYFVRTFIRGPVCRGSTAVNVINEQFYVMFVNPETYGDQLHEFVNRNKSLLDFPAQHGSDVDVTSVTGLLSAIGKGKAQEMKAISTVMLGTKLLSRAKLRLSGRKKPTAGLSGHRIKYRNNRLALFKKHRPNGYQLDDIWNGGQEENKNALLTVLRHYDSASVSKGALGPTPKTMWLIDYPLLEGLYYNLVSGFDVYGDAGHQASTRYYKSSQRLDGEEHFLHLIPKQYRKPMRSEWYRDGNSGGRKVSRVVQKWYPIEDIDHDAIPVQGSWPKKASRKVSPKQLEDIRAQVFAKIYEERFKDLYANSKEASINASEFSIINGKKDAFVQFFPDLSFIRYGKKVFTLVRNKQHYNVTWSQDEDLRRDFSNDVLFVVRGFVGSYPLQFFDASSTGSLQIFAEMISQVRSASQYAAFKKRFAIGRSDKENFWPTFDFMRSAMYKQDPIEAGIFDLNRYDIKTAK